ncbi:DEAD/DEAH box helicase [Candidatus Sumerlaeota bacterium]|nr:DEAD/DEAH box helicase [Candidatus Sumerlaeota bacterium]
MSLPVEHLVTLGLSRRGVEAWRADGLRELLPLQEKALAEHGFMHGANLLVFAPTSSGKTFVAEMAALKRLEQNRRVVYLVPTKALAEEKYREFYDRYAPQGYRVAVATRERPATDRAVFEGRYDLLVAVYEKMKAYLVARPEMLSSVALVVADEIQSLGDPGRGDTIDLLLTKIAHAPYGCQFIGLSAVLGDDASRLARALGCDLMVWRRRPLDLREGVYDHSRNVFVYREFNSGEKGEEVLAGAERDPGAEPSEPSDPSSESDLSDFRREAVFDLVEQIALDRGEQVLAFVPTRNVSRNWAHHLALRLRLPGSEAAVEEIACHEETHARDLLRETLGHGVGFHNADLPWDLRALIEDHFNSGAIRVLVSTSTLGQGVNLAGRNVVHVPAMVTTDRWTGRQAVVALSRSRFRNQGGRGARLKREEGFGRSILVASNPQECERLMRDYVEGDFENLTPQIRPEALDAHVLDLVASRVATDASALAEFFHATFSGRTLWPADSAEVRRRVADSVESLGERSLIAHAPEGRLEATGLGEVGAATGLQPTTIESVARWLREGPKAVVEDPTEALVVLAATDDGRDFPVGGAGSAETSGGWVETLRERLLRRAEGVAPSVEAILCPPGGFSRDGLLDLKKALILDAWIGPGETREIEERFQIFSGTAANLASHFAWLAEGAAAMAKALALPATVARALGDLAERLVLGCGPQGLALRVLRVQGLSRSALQTLLREGYDTIEALAEADEEALARLVPRRIAREIAHEIVRETVRETTRLSQPKRTGSARSVKKPATPRPTRGDTPPAPLSTASTESTSSTPSTPPTGGAQVLLEIDLRGPGCARLNGQDLRLPPLPLQLLAVLARSPDVGVSYADLMATVWRDAHVESQQIHAHRTRIVRAAEPILGCQAARDLIPIRRGLGLCLALPPSAIRILEK